MDNPNPHISNTNLNPAPSTSQQEELDMFEGTQSIASTPSSADALNMTQLESKLETEMVKMARMVKDSISSLATQMERGMTELREEFNLKFQSLSTGVNATNSLSTNTSVSQSNQNNSTSQTNGSNYFSNPILTQSQSRGDNCSTRDHRLKLKPQNFSGESNSDFEEYLAQFELTCEINNWDYKEKSLYLANSLTGEARSVLNELDHAGRRDYKILVEKLTIRFGSKNKSEIYRSQLKTRVKTKTETIPQLATSVKKLVKQAYPGINQDAIEALSLDNFVDAMPDSDIRFRLRELGPKTMAEAEQIAVRMEAHKIADKQRSRTVARLDCDVELASTKKDSSEDKFDNLSDSITSLTNQVQKLAKPEDRDFN